MILVIGDVMVDRYLTGEVERMSPEAPEAPVVRLNSFKYMLGGAANVWHQVRAMGERCSLLGVVGSDYWGSILRAHFAEHDASELVVDNERRTTVKTRVMHGHRQICRMDEEDQHPLSAMQDRMARLIRCIAEEASVIVLSDYGKGVLTHRLCIEAIASAKMRDVPVIVDPKRQDFSAYYGATVITPNDTELESTGLDPYELINLSAAAILHKRGAYGMTLHERKPCIDRFTGRFDYSYVRTHIPVVDGPVVDVTGAGDAVVAALAVALMRGCSLQHAAKIAAEAAAEAVATPGTGQIGKDVIQ